MARPDVAIGMALLVRDRRDAGELAESGLQAEVASLKQRLDQLLNRPAVRHPDNRRLLKLQGSSPVQSGCRRTPCG